VEVDKPARLIIRLSFGFVSHSDSVFVKFTLAKRMELVCLPDFKEQIFKE